MGFYKLSVPEQGIISLKMLPPAALVSLGTADTFCPLAHPDAQQNVAGWVDLMLFCTCLLLPVGLVIRVINSTGKRKDNFNS